MFAPLAGTSGLSSSGHDQPGDIIGGQAGPQRGVGPAQHLGVDGARADADGADAVRTALHRDRLGEADDSVLGDVVGGQARELLGGVDPGQRGDQDDPAFAGRAHGGEGRPATEERTGQVDAERLLPDPGRGLGERHGSQHPGRAYQRGDRADLAGRGEKTLDVGVLAHIRGYRRRLAARLADAAGHAVEGVAVTGGQHDVSACRGDGFGGGRPDPAAGARDHRHPSG